MVEVVVDDLVVVDVIVVDVVVVDVAVVDLVGIVAIFVVDGLRETSGVFVIVETNLLDRICVVNIS